MTLNTKYGEIKIFARTVEEAAVGQITVMANSILGENAHIRIMPDAHAGAGCVVGTTMTIKDKVCPNLVGVDIGCGVTMVKSDGDFKGKPDKVDKIIRERIPAGTNVHSNPSKSTAFLENLRCYKRLDKRALELVSRSMGTLGGGNHFIETYDEGYIAVHSGSRNIGLKVAEYYQDLAIESVARAMRELESEAIKNCPPVMREQYIKDNKGNRSIVKNLAYLTGADKDDYLHDMSVLQKFASLNRNTMLDVILKEMKFRAEETVDSVHNYIDIKNMILRKGAISAQNGEILVIPLNMRDGILICKGKGNEDWNYSAPHGAGRLYSRSAAKNHFTVGEYQRAMKGIYSSCISASTLDEAPFVYKNYEEIMEAVEPTVNILTRIKPIFNFKAANDK
jgi:RNA-splicing ligase RtcB